MGEFNKRYSNLFGLEDEVDADEGEESDSEEEDEDGDKGTDYITKFNKQWGWFNWAVQVKEIKSIPLDDVFEIGIVEFLNILCYIKDKNALERKQQEEYMKKLKRR